MVKGKKIRKKEEKSGKAEKKNLSGEKMEKMLSKAEEAISKINGDSDSNIDLDREITFKTSKPIAQIKKGDKIKIDGGDYEVDAHYALMDHGSTKEMAIEIFDDNDKDHQLRYFDDQVESTIDFYELQEIMYFKKPFKKIEW